MRIVISFFVLFCIFAMPTNGFAQNGKSLKAYLSEAASYIWAPPVPNFKSPHLHDARTPHNTQWQDNNWTPQEWTDARGGNPMNVIQGFYDADIIRDQNFNKDEVPVLIVGQGFINLSDGEKRRVAMYVDDTYGITRSNPQAAYLLEFYKKSKAVGIFTKDGLQLQ